MVASEALISEVTIRDQASAAADRITAALERLGKSEEEVQGSTARAGRAIETAGRTFERLKAAVDPLYAAQQRLAQTQNQLNRAVELGVASQAEATALMQRHITTANNAARGGAAGFGSLGSAIQQAGFQIGDFAVQVASGGGVLRPLIQQGTQLVSMFGPMGAAIGAAGAVIGALVPVIWSWATAADGAAMSQEKLNETLKDMDALQKQIEGNTQRNRDSLQAQLNYDLSKIQSAFDKAKAQLDRTPKTMVDPNTGSGAVANPDYGPVHDYYVKLQADLYAAKEASGQFADSFARMGQEVGSGSASTAKSIHEVTESMEEQLRLLKMNKQEREADKIVDEQLGKLQMSRAGASKELLDTLTRLAEAQVAQTKANKDAEDGQRKAIENTKAVASSLAALQKQYDDLSKASVDIRAVDQFAGKMPTDADLARARELLRLIDEEKASRAADKAFEAEIDQLIEQGTRGVQQRAQWFRNGLQSQESQIALLEKEIELNGANDNVSQLALAHLRAQQEVHAQIGAGLDVNAQKYIDNADAIARMNQQLTKQRAVAQELPQFFDQAFDRIGSAITQAMATGEIAMTNLLDLGRSVVSELIQEFIKLALMNPLKNWINGDDALPTFTSVLGSLFSTGSSISGLGGLNTTTGMLGHAARGGYIEVGEKGPERFYPNTSGTIVPNGAGGGGIIVNAPITITGGGGTNEQNRDLATQMQGRLQRAVEEAVDRRLAHHRRTGNMLNGGLAA